MSDTSPSMQAYFDSIADETVPHINTNGFSALDQEQADSIYMLLENLNSLIDHFRNAVELFNYADSHADKRMAWCAIACRDASMTIGHFHETLEYVLRAVKKCPPLKSEKRERALRSVVGRAKAQLPEKIRHTTAHSTKHFGTPDARRKNRLRGTPILVQNCWTAEGKVTHSVDGDELSFEMNENTVLKLQELRNGVFAAFR